MKRQLLLATTALILASSAPQTLFSHCQMPCGIYHDAMVYDQVDQYAETMYKACAELTSHDSDAVKDKQQFTRWVMQKEKASDEITVLITTYFLQQKIKPDEADTQQRITLAHKLLFLVVQIKQNCDVKFVHEFMESWEKFKHMFHRQDYECKIEQSKLQQWRKEAEELKAKEAASKDGKPLAESHPHTHDHRHDHTHDDAH